MGEDGRVLAPTGSERETATEPHSGYSVDLDRVPEVVAELRRALHALERAADEARGNADLVAPGHDPHSRRAAHEMGPRLVAEYLTANEREQEELRAMIAGVEDAMRRYEAREEETGRALRSVSE
ncbi:hypothetical protein CDG81_00420 [Actinopolyspora erythraea]|uniref:PE domain-containing protein n=2 Tax=Actinopolyspora erythraea TaxID=414996 RepID=A0A099DBF0_9ACTN|nr:hypothetical protein CDG81_00420 [Actinopolyspora erythraea]KGI83062.1 hypothetical protein IL38_01255 [Actinopolyspora erythraea]